MWFLFVATLVMATAATAATTSNGNDVDDELPCIPPPMKLPDDLVDRPNKVIIAHRGASAHLPEHTIPAYRLAMELGADYVEPDLVATKDGHLIAIHSMDLNYTTDVATKFPDRLEYSPYLNRTGYFTYNFNLDEIKTLRVHQRLPRVRTQTFDGMFGIPTFTEILELVNDWNTNIDPLLVNSTLRRAKKGIYAELKDYSWLLEDAQTDLLDLFFGYMSTELWEKTIFDNLCSTKILHPREYLLPPLVIQSFEAAVLEQFTQRWETEFKDKLHERPVPPRTLLVDSSDCLQEGFWFNVGESWHKFITGVGPDKECLKGNWRQFMTPAKKHRLAVHPWTQRPELEYVVSVPEEALFESSLEETIRFFCIVGIHGIFTESVSTTMLAAASCDKDFDDQESGTDSNKKNKKKKTDNSDSDGGANSLCYESEKEANMYVGLACFVFGCFLSTLVVLWAVKRSPEKARRQLRIPTEEIPDHELEMM